jgi:phage shock protein PspC (stress-responsive transcriptional regulator)
MKTTLTVNIGGMSFTIDDDAYARLNAYITALKQKYSSQAGGDEIVSDIESRIAELFAQEIKSAQQVVNLRMVKQVIATLGDEEDLDAGASYQTFTNDQRKTTMAYKKFYRDPNGMVIGGVCTGLSHYFNLDPVLFRIIFIALLLGGITVILYPLIWIITPLATTPSQRLEMRGEPITPENLEREYQQMKYNRK